MCVLHFVQPPTKEPSVILKLVSVLPGELQGSGITYSTNVKKSWHQTGALRSDVRQAELIIRSAGYQEQRSDLHRDVCVCYMC